MNPILYSLFGFLTLSTLSSAKCSLPAVVFVPGFVGSQLYVTVENAAAVPEECSGVDIPIGDPFLALINVTLDVRHSQCMAALLATPFDEASGFSSVPGVTVSTRAFGDFSGISPVYWSFAQQLEVWGYELGVNAFAAPYDYRFMTTSSLEKIGLIAQMKNLIESTFETQGIKSVLIGHSNGGPTAYSFLSAMDEAWLEKYVASYIGLSGNMLGQMNALKPFVNMPFPDLQAMETSWEAAFMSMSWGEYPPVGGIPVVTAFAGQDKEKNYTLTLADMQDLFHSLHRDDWFDKFINVYPNMNRTKMPHCDSYCLYGIDLDTTYSFVFSGQVSSSPLIEERTMSGDGNQDAIDNTFCAIWASTNTGDYQLVSEPFPGVSHMHMYSDDDVMAFVWDILSTYIVDDPSLLSASQ